MYFLPETAPGSKRAKQRRPLYCAKQSILSLTGTTGVRMMTAGITYTAMVPFAVYAFDPRQS